MLTDYKFWFIRRNDDGFIIDAGIRFFEGDFSTVSERDIVTGKVAQASKYIRTRRLAPQELRHLDAEGFTKDANNNDAVIYTQKQFGVIKTNDELRTFLNREIEKDATREVVNDQRVVVERLAEVTD